MTRHVNRNFHKLCYNSTEFCDGQQIDAITVIRRTPTLHLFGRRSVRKNIYRQNQKQSPPSGIAWIWISLVELSGIEPLTSSLRIQEIDSDDAIPKKPK
jgi:hypothetical protein